MKIGPLALAASLVFSAVTFTPTAFSQTSITLAQAQAALTQTKAQAAIDLKAVPDCRALTGSDRAKCNHDSAAQISAINKRLADAQKVVTNLQAQASQPARPAQTNPPAQANQQAQTSQQARPAPAQSATNATPAPASAPVPLPKHPTLAQAQENLDSITA